MIPGIHALHPTGQQVVQNRSKNRKQLKHQLELMLEYATNLQDKLAIKLARAELAVVDNPDYKYKLY